MIILYIFYFGFSISQCCAHLQVVLGTVIGNMAWQRKPSLVDLLLIIWGFSVDVCNMSVCDPTGVLIPLHLMGRELKKPLGWEVKLKFLEDTLPFLKLQRHVPHSLASVKMLKYKNVLILKLQWAGTCWVKKDLFIVEFFPKIYMFSICKLFVLFFRM